MGIWSPAGTPTAGNDTFTGDGTGETAFGSLGNDLLNGNAGNDILNGNEDNDILNGGAGDDQLNGGGQNDILHGNDGNDVLRAGTSFADRLLLPFKADLSLLHEFNPTLRPNQYLQVLVPDQPATAFSFSPNGDRILFQSTTFAVPGVTNLGANIYMYTPSTDTLVMVNTTDAGTQPTTTYVSILPVFSPDGNRVAFLSDSAFLDPPDTNGLVDVFVKNLVTGDIERISLSQSGVQANGFARAVTWLDNDTLLLDTNATNMVDGQVFATRQLYITHLSTGVVEALQFDGRSAADLVLDFGFLNYFAISDDRTRYVFASSASDLVASDTNGFVDIFLYDTKSQSFSLVSTSSSGAPVDPAFGGSTGSVRPDISPDGTLVVFVSSGGNLVVNDTNSLPDIFVKNTTTGATTRINLTNAGIEGSNFAISSQPQFSPDGSMVLFGLNSAGLGLGSGLYVWSVETGLVSPVYGFTLGMVGVPAGWYAPSPLLNASWLPDSSGIVGVIGSLHPMIFRISQDSDGTNQLFGDAGDDVLVAGSGETSPVSTLQT